MTAALVAAVITAIAGGATQAITGFGFALVAVPLLSLALTAHDAVIAVTATSAVLSAGAGLRDRQHIDRPLAARITAAAVVGMPFGLLALLLLPPRALTFAVAAVALVFLALSLTPIKLGTGTAPAAIAGVVSGAALTSTGMNGPPLVAGLHALRLPALRQRATLQAMFTAQDVLAVIAFAAAGQMPGRIWLLTVVAIPGAGLGWLLGNRLFHRLDEATSRRLVVAVLLATTITLVTRAALS